MKPAAADDDHMMPYFASLILELVCLAFYIFRFCHLWHFSNKDRYCKTDLFNAYEKNRIPQIDKNKYHTL